MARFSPIYSGQFGYHNKPGRRGPNYEVAASSGIRRGPNYEAAASGIMLSKIIKMKIKIR